MFPYTFIDLTHSLEQGIPAWDTACGFHQEIDLDYSPCGGDVTFRVMKMAMPAGIGTHMDAPSHCVPGGACIEELDLNALCMPCVVIDVSKKAHARYRVSQQDILDFEALYGDINPGSCVLIQTGWEKFWKTPQKYHNGHIFPSVCVQAAHFLLARGVEALGIDTLSPDRPEDGFHVHQAFLEKGKILIENAAHLDKMPTLGAYVMCVPLKIKGGTESPIRLIGLVKK